MKVKGFPAFSRRWCQLPRKEPCPFRFQPKARSAGQLRWQRWFQSMLLEHWGRLTPEQKRLWHVAAGELRRHFPKQHGGIRGQDMFLSIMAARQREGWEASDDPPSPAEVVEIVLNKKRGRQVPMGDEAAAVVDPNADEGQAEGPVGESAGQSAECDQAAQTREDRDELPPLSEQEPEAPRPEPLPTVETAQAAPMLPEMTAEEREKYGPARYRRSMPNPEAEDWQTCFWELAKQQRWTCSRQYFHAKIARLMESIRPGIIEAVLSAPESRGKPLSRLTDLMRVKEHQLWKIEQEAAWKPLQGTNSRECEGWSHG